MNKINTSPLPRAFATRMASQLENEWAAFQQAHHNAAPVSIRANPRKGNRRSLESVPWTSFGFYLPSRPVFALDPAWHAGVYYVQEASSMFLEQAILQHVSTRENIKVLDLCAAPGGKSTHLLSLLPESALLVSNEVIQSRATVLSENIQKWGHSNVVITRNDPKDFQRLEGWFDVVVVDAPCSGEGLFRKDMEARKEWSPQHVDLCAVRQRRILTDVWPSLKKDGLLIYCTCTYSHEENEHNLENFARQHDVEFLPITTVPAWNIQETRLNDVIGYRMMPHRVAGEGFFIAAMRKRESTTRVRPQRNKPFSMPSKKINSLLTDWLSTEHTLILQHENVLAISSHQAEWIAELSNAMHVIVKGVAIAALKHDKAIPQHSLALHTALAQNNFPSVHVDTTTAIQYLKKETMSHEFTAQGFTLIKHDEYALGWVNALQTRVNNMYPSNWRIRMAVNTPDTQ